MQPTRESRTRTQANFSLSLATQASPVKLKDKPSGIPNQGSLRRGFACSTQTAGKPKIRRHALSCPRCVFS